MPNPERAPKPDNFDEMAAAWADPHQWAAQVGQYNVQLSGSGFETISQAMGREHSKHVMEHTLKNRFPDVDRDTGVVG